MNPTVMRLLRAKGLLLSAAHHPEISRVIATIDSELRRLELEKRRCEG